jgi:hypothetical protein
MCTANCGLEESNCRPSVPVMRLLSLTSREMDSTSSSLTVALVAWEAVRFRLLWLLVSDVVLLVVPRDTCLVSQRRGLDRCDLDRCAKLHLDCIP